MGQAPSVDHYRHPRRPSRRSASDDSSEGLFRDNAAPREHRRGSEADDTAQQPRRRFGGSFLGGSSVSSGGGSTGSTGPAATTSSPSTTPQVEEGSRFSLIRFRGVHTRSETSVEIPEEEESDFSVTGNTQEGTMALQDDPPSLVDFDELSSDGNFDNLVHPDNALDRSILRAPREQEESARSVIVPDNPSSPSRVRPVFIDSSTALASQLSSSSDGNKSDLMAGYDSSESPQLQMREGSFDENSNVYYRRASVTSSEAGSTTMSELDEEDDAFSHTNNRNVDFHPQPSRDYEWMGRSVESLVLGHVARAPIVMLVDDEDLDDNEYYAHRRRSTASTFGGGAYRRRSSQGSFPGGRRGSLSLAGANTHGGTLANYYNRRQLRPNDVDRSYNERQGRRGSTSHTPMFRRRSSMATSGGAGDGECGRPGIGSKAGPNTVLSLMARENTGMSCFPRGIPPTQCLRSMGGHSLFASLDKPAGGIATEVAFLAAAIDTGDWTETQTIISRLAPRLVGDPMAAVSGNERPVFEDPNLPPNTPRFYAGGGRTGLERDAFVHAGGVEVLIRVFREKGFVGQEMAYSYDARDLSPEIVGSRLAPSWNEALASLRELVFAMPSLVEDRKISDNGEFLPFLFTLLSHDACFDVAAALIEEILAILSQSPPQQSDVGGDGSPDGSSFHPKGHTSPPTTFYLGNVPDLYKLWGGFSCRQLAHFCRILALLVFEPEDRLLLESPAVLKSLELLQLRRNRAVRSGRDSTVDMNQAILIGDPLLIRRLVMLLRVMNFAPPLRSIAPYHVIAQYPLIADTLVMLGLGELDSWDEIDREEALARELLEDDADGQVICNLGGVAGMLESLSETLGEASNQIGHIIQVITAAQRAGVIVGRNTGRVSANGAHSNNMYPPSVEDEESAAAALRLGGFSVEDVTIQGLASVAGILTDQVLVRRLHQNSVEEFDGGYHEEGANANGNRHFINTPQDSANSLSFNAILLASYQVEVLFVLCTLLGGRRKLDAQDALVEIGLVPVLHDMFQRLPWYHGSTSGPDQHGGERESQPSGIHGPGCDCTPENALCVQFLRLVHNFCDRDCDNYTGRRLLLSDEEQKFLLHGTLVGVEPIRPGLLSKIISAFVNESDESPYRFWLASCIEAYLRGSSPEEQLFAAQSGLMAHLVEDVSSDRLHCAGSLQTSFDLLGEISKGNASVVRLLVHDLDEESFRKLMSVAAANLVDSNVFVRSLLLSLERLASTERFVPLYVESSMDSSALRSWVSHSGRCSRSFLTHSWWDTCAIPLSASEQSGGDEPFDERRPADWFPSPELLRMKGRVLEAPLLPDGVEESVGHFGWVFTPGGDSLSASTYLPNTVERLSWFLAANQARLLRDLLGVVDLRNINHENICCLNTAVVIAIFAYRRRQLSELLQELRNMNDEEKETQRRAAQHDDADIVDRAFVHAMRYFELENHRSTPSYARMASIASASPGQQIGDRTDVMRNFREVLWFWIEYYTHRGRDRLSLEFSSHIRFQEWNHVVSLLVADDGSPTALVRSPPRLPRSPYQRSARIADNPVRGV